MSIPALLSCTISLSRSVHDPSRYEVAPCAGELMRLLSDARRMSRSTSSTRLPFLASAEAVLIATYDLPLPGLNDVQMHTGTLLNFAKWWSSSVRSIRNASLPKSLFVKSGGVRLLSP